MTFTRNNYDYHLQLTTDYLQAVLQLYRLNSPLPTGHRPSFADPIDGAFGQATVFPETTMSKPCRACALEPAIGGATCAFEPAVGGAT